MKVRVEKSGKHQNWIAKMAANIWEVSADVISQLGCSSLLCHFACRSFCKKKILKRTKKLFHLSEEKLQGKTFNHSVCVVWSYLHNLNIQIIPTKMRGDFLDVWWKGNVEWKAINTSELNFHI